MKIRILKLEGTGISTDQYEVGQIVDADPQSMKHSCVIPDARGGTYLVIDKWYEVVN